MVGSRLDPSPWNLGVPLALVAACGPPLLGDSVDDGIGSTISGPDESESGPGTTTPSTTLTTSVPDCYTDEQCPPNYDCVGGKCYYGGYCDDDDYCCYGECCGPECGWYYDCYSNAECGTGYVCNYGSCQPIEAEIGCNVPNLGLQIPIPIDGPIYSLAFLDDGNGGADLLIGRDDGVQRVDAQALTPAPLGAAVFGATSIAVRDLDADGDRDVVVSTDYEGINEVQVLRDDGAWSNFVIPGMPSLGGVAIADVEADSYPDVYSYGPNGPVYLSFNYGMGWSEAVYVTDVATSLVTGDVDGDGLEDAVAHGYYTQTVTNGAALQVGQLYTGRNFGTTKVLALGDFDGSGIADVLALEVTSGSTTLVSAWQGPVPYSVAYDTWWSSPANHTAVADMNQDGLQDVVAGSEQGYLSVAYGGVEPPPDVISCVGSIGTLAIYAIAAGDFTGDGRPDVAVSDGSSVFVLAQSP